VPDLPDLEGVLSRLIRGQVDFVVIGGFAAVAHGATLVTQDVDVCCDFSSDNLLRLQAALAELHPVHRTPARPPLRLTAETSREFQNLYLDTDFGPLDCLGRVKGIGPFEAVKGRSVEVELTAGICRILSIDALIEAKQAMGRRRDREAVIELEAIRERQGGGPGPADANGR